MTCSTDCAIHRHTALKKAHEALAALPADASMVRHAGLGTRPHLTYIEVGSGEAAEALALALRSHLPDIMRDAVDLLAVKVEQAWDAAHQQALEVLRDQGADGEDAA